MKSDEWTWCIQWKMNDNESTLSMNHNLDDVDLNFI